MDRQDPRKAEIEDLNARLTEALQALEAIRTGGVDALVVCQDGEERVFTLAGAEQPYRVMVETMNEGAAALSEDGVILWGNACLAQMLQQPLERILGTPMNAYLAPDSRDAYEAILAQTNQEQHKLEVDLQGSDGSRLPVLLSISRFRNENHPANYSLVLTDLTEQRRSAQIAAAERLASAIIEQAAEPIVVCDQNGRVQRASHSAFRLAGQNPLFQPFEAAFPLRLDPPASDSDRFSIQAVLHGTVFRGVEATLERSLPGAQPETLNVLVSATRFTVTGNGAIGCVITLTDQTERKQAEEAIHRYAVQLEQSNRDLQEFAFVASHDLQEPLRKIKQFGNQLFSRLDGDEVTQDYIRRMRSAAERMDAMIQDLLELSRVSTRGGEFESVDLSQVAEEVLSDLEVSLQQAGGQVDLGNLPAVEADPVQMRQLLQNLIGNAIKFHRPGVAPQVRVTAKVDRRRTGETPQAVLCVEDNGIGFGDEEAERIFLPFQRLHGRSSEYDGSGMGLSICKKIVERHGGTIAAQSTAGQGSTFIVTLPVKRTESG